MAREREKSNGDGPGLRVDLQVTPNEARHDSIAVRVDVSPPTRPLRISVYLDGRLMETWAPRADSEQLELSDVRGRHVITARAVDGSGRWGGASALVDVGGGAPDRPGAPPG